MNNKHYDLIGDVHGQAVELTSLLRLLSYTQINGVWQHPERTVIFLGDFIDGGINQTEVIDIVRPMIEQNHALAVMGNHEYNAIAYYTKTSEGGYLRPHTQSNKIQHGRFLDAYEQDPINYHNTIEWFKTLPLWLDLGDIRVVHACWDEESMAIIDHGENNKPLLSDKLLHTSSIKNTAEYQAIETILKGKEIQLPEGRSFKDNYGKVRTTIRTEWWKSYPANAAPVFFGHYWMCNAITPQANNAACVDYSVAREGGRLVAYQWDGERNLNTSKFIFVDRAEVN